MIGISPLKTYLPVESSLLVDLTKYLKPRNVLQEYWDKIDEIVQNMKLKCKITMNSEQTAIILFSRIVDFKI